MRELRYRVRRLLAVKDVFGAYLLGCVLGCLRGYELVLFGLLGQLLLLGGEGGGGGGGIFK